MTKEYHFKFEVTIADYEAFNVFVTNQAFKKNRVYRVAVGVGILLIACFNFYLTHFTLKPDMVLFFFLGIYWAFLLPILSKQTIKKRAKAVINNARPGAVIGYRDMVISEEHIWYQSELYDNKLKWGAIQKLEQMPQNVLLFLADTSALIIPTSEIGDANAVSEFVSFARQQIDKSQNKEEIAAHLVG